MPFHPTARTDDLDGGTAPSPAGPGPQLDLNAVVAYNLKAVRLLRRLTQEQVAERLALFTGRRLPQASISHMERTVDGGRRRLFSAHDLHLLAKVFDVPIVYFFLPPPGFLAQEVADTGERVDALLDSLFGTPAQERVVDNRLVEVADRLREDGAEPDAARDTEARCLRIRRIMATDCDARLREVTRLLQELTDHLQPDYSSSGSRPSS